MYNYGNMNNYYINGWYLLKYKYISLCVRAGVLASWRSGWEEYKAPKFTIIVYILYGHSTVFRICGDLWCVWCVF